jgi:hypothetical protein
MPRKIKVVDVIHEIDIDDTVQPIDIDSEKPFEPIEEDIKKTIEPIEEDIKEEQQIAIIPDTKVRTNELHSCRKCGKFMTLKTLKYTHENTCSVGRIPEPPTKPVTQHKKQLLLLYGALMHQTESADKAVCAPAPSKRVWTSYTLHSAKRCGPPGPRGHGPRFGRRSALVFRA